MARVLTTQDRFTCPHDGAVATMSSNGFHVDGLVALLADVGPTQAVTGCLAEPPCVMAAIDASASPLTEGGFHVVLDTATGTARQDDGTVAGALVFVPGPDPGLDGGIQLT